MRVGEAKFAVWIVLDQQHVAPTDLVGQGASVCLGVGDAGRVLVVRSDDDQLVAVSQEAGEGFHIERRASRLPPLMNAPRCCQAWHGMIHSTVHEQHT